MRHRTPGHLVETTRLAGFAAWCFLWVFATGCTRGLHREVADPERIDSLDPDAPYLKAHTRRGDVYILSPWVHSEAQKRVSGTGRLLDPNRRTIASGDFSVPLDSVVLFETNDTRPSGGVAALSIITGVSAALTVYCAQNTKACFGSCPTFYVNDGTEDLLQAEGFSASIAPSLEASDVDHLYRARPDSRQFDVRMTNEALETHVVRYVDVLAVDRGGHRRVFVDEAGRFWPASHIRSASTCRSPEGNCLRSIEAFDGRERSSLADSTDLAARETMELTFAAPDAQRLGLVVASRQTLLPTYLLYQTLAWFGSSASTWLAALERGDRHTADRVASVVQTLGAIDVSVLDDTGRWQSVGSVAETGPLGTDVRLVSLPLQRDSIRVRLSMAKGTWRIDYVALASLGDSVEVLRLQPMTVTSNSSEDEALELLLDSSRVLTTFPGDEYTLKYELPADYERYELFLESRGYYLEWMRDEWIAEENLRRVAQLFFNPSRALRRLAPEFKRAEPEMENAFWNSRYVRH